MRAVRIARLPAVAVALAFGFLAACASALDQEEAPPARVPLPKPQPLDITGAGPEMFADQFFHVGYEFKLMRAHMERQGQGELWVSFKGGLTRIRLQGMANSPRFGDGAINLVIDTETKTLFSTFRLSKLHESECLSYPFPDISENQDRMEKLRWRLHQVKAWQLLHGGDWGEDAFHYFDKDRSGDIDADELQAVLKGAGYDYQSAVKKALSVADKDASDTISYEEFRKPNLHVYLSNFTGWWFWEDRANMSIQWTKSTHLDFKLSRSSKELHGLSLRHGDRVVKTVDLHSVNETENPNIFTQPHNCKPAAELKEHIATLEFKSPYAKSSALNDLLLLLTDTPQQWPQLFLVLSAVIVPGDIAIMIEDPAPPHLEKLGGVFFDYEAAVYSADSSAQGSSKDSKKRKTRHTSAGRVWLNLGKSEFRLSGEAKSTKVGPLDLDLVAQGPTKLVYANVNLKLQLEQQCVTYEYPPASEDILQELSFVSSKQLTFFSIAEHEGEDCGIFVAPLAHGRWIHLFIDTEHDRPEAILRSEIHKGGKLLRSIDIKAWSTRQETESQIVPEESWQCKQDSPGLEQLARLGLRRSQHWSVELQDALHALVELPQAFSILEVLALVGDVAIMVHEPDLPELSQLTQATLYFKMIDNHQYTEGIFAASYQAGQLRLHAGSRDADATNISIALSHETLAVRVEDARMPEPQCLTTAVTETTGCSFSSWNAVCALEGAGRCAKTRPSEDSYQCKELQCYDSCTQRFGMGTDGSDCAQNGATAADSRLCTSSNTVCLSCHYACMASCETLPPVSAPCMAQLFQDIHFNGFEGDFPEGSYDINDLNQRGIPNNEASSLLVSGDSCVATLFSESNWTGLHMSFQEGSYEAEDLNAYGLHDTASSLVVERQPLQLVRSNGESDFMKRTLVDGVISFSDSSQHRYLQVPEEMQGAVLFAGPRRSAAGDLTLNSPKSGWAYIWGAEDNKAGPQILSRHDWKNVGEIACERHGETHHYMQVFRRELQAGHPIVIPVSNTWLGGIAFKEKQMTNVVNVIGLWRDSPDNSTFDGRAAIFNGVDMFGDRECDRFSLMMPGFSIELWYSPLEAAICRIQVLPDLKSRVGALVEVQEFSSRYLPDSDEASVTLAEAPTNWNCKAADMVANRWLSITPKPQALEDIALLPAAALYKLAEALGPVGLLPLRAVELLTKISITSPPYDVSVTSKPPAEIVDIFGDELRTFSFQFISASRRSINAAAAPGARHGRGEVRVDLDRRRLYMRMEGINVSAGIPDVNSKILLLGDAGNLYVQTEIRTDDFTQCFSIDTRETLSRLLHTPEQNPFQKARRAGPGAGFVGTIEMGPEKSAEIFLDDDRRLSSLSVTDASRNIVTNIQVHEWSTEPIDPTWFEQGEECSNLNLLEHGDALASWDLLTLIFPQVEAEPADVSPGGSGRSLFEV